MNLCTSVWNKEEDQRPEWHYNPSQHSQAKNKRSTNTSHRQYSVPQVFLQRKLLFYSNCSLCLQQKPLTLHQNVEHLKPLSHLNWMRSCMYHQYHTVGLFFVLNTAKGCLCVKQPGVSWGGIYHQECSEFPRQKILKCRVLSKTTHFPGLRWAPT